jgi:CheY-like chemotaxis protein
MPSQSKRVLVVDNNDEESQVLASILDGAGYRPTTTWSGLEALELLESQEFDIVLVSSYLPDPYVGDFFDRFNRLPVRPCVIVMQEGKAAKGAITPAETSNRAVGRTARLRDIGLRRLQSGVGWFRKAGWAV